MANLKLVFTISSILLALVFSNGVVGRPMKKGHVTTYENMVKELGAAAGDSVPLWRRSIMENAPDSHSPHDGGDGRVEKWIDDFRPTDPGHSPGAGHSSPTPKGPRP
ncbi:precursor of CEP3 [Cajanus cajan]|uniref:Uncharacterized protein n=1 Tax=Cajanus cajan TaxID=3821 RepID=A0A151S843_CAJCA|nr:precursor of CEP3 [Cajanus cajan]KYP50937.1 hypothetical protein KK1_027297 [Cajanus cajan]